MTTADRVIVFRYMIHSLAAEAGMLATFMPKPFST
jgi:glutamine synthetase